MADNVPFQTSTAATPASGTTVASKEVTFSGDTTKVQLVELVGVTGSEGSRTLTEITDASGLKIQDGGNSITVDGTVAVTGVATATKQDDQSTLIGAVTETAPATDTASSGLNGRLQRIAQRLTSLIALLVQFVTGGGTEAAALRVTVASDSTGVLSVDDNGSSLTVDGTVAVSGTVAVTQSGTWDEVGINDSGNSITVDGTVSVSGNVPGTSATSLGKAEDAVAGDGDTGVMVLAVRKDTAASTVGADGDYHPLEVDANGRLHVIEPSAAAIAASLSVLDDWDESDRAKTNPIVGQAGISAGAGAVATNTPRTTLASDDPAVASLGVMDDWDESDRAKVNLVVGQAGVTAGAGAVAANTPRVTHASDDPVTVSVQLIDDAIFAEDAASANADKGIQILTVRKDTAAATSGTDADYQPLITDANGRLHVLDQNSAAALTSLQLIDDTVFTDDNAFTPGTSKVLAVGAQADESSTDSIDEGDAGALRMTLDRKLITTPQPHTAGGLSVYRSIDLDEGTCEVIKASPGQIYGWYIANLATTTRFVKFYDATSGTVGTGTPLLTLPIPGNSTDDIAANALGAMGITFATGICFGAVTGVADNDTGAPGANDVIANIFYK